MDDKQFFYWIGHSLIHRIVKFSFTIEAKEPLRIGAGRKAVPESPTDLPVLRINIGGAKKPYIPGSSLKGLFRSYMDVFIKSHGGYTCNPIGGYTCIKSIKKDIGKFIGIGDYDRIADLLWRRLCLSCKVFGSGGYRSKTIFSDSYPDGDVRIGIKTGIMIDRKRGTTTSGALYQVEYVEPGSKFESGFHAYDVPNYVLAILGMTLFELNNGFLRIGGFKTRGFGRVEIKNLRITFDIRSRLGGEVNENKIILKRMDHLDEDIIVEVGDDNSISNENAWNFLKDLIDTFIRDRVVFEKIKDEHIPKR